MIFPPVGGYQLILPPTLSYWTDQRNGPAPPTNKPLANLVR